MIEQVLYTLGSVFLVSVVSFVGIITLSIKERLLHQILFILVGVAAGTLFGDAFIHLIPEAFAGIENPAFASLMILFGVLSFFALEKFLRWKHVHDVEPECDDEEHCDVAALETEKVKPLGPLVIVSDGVHNFIDGIIIAASYLVGIEVGIATTLAVVLHEIPQEIGDFGLLLHAGFTKWKALLLNFFSAIFSILGAVLTLVVGVSIESFVPAIVGFAAGSFLYIAGSDLVPEIHKTSHLGRSFVQFLAIIFGIGIMFLLLLAEN